MVSMNAKLVVHMKALIAMHGRDDVYDALEAAVEDVGGDHASLNARGRKRLEPPDNIADLIAQHGTIGTARMLGVSPPVVSRWRDNLGIKRKRKESRVVAPDNLNELLENYGDHRIAGMIGAPPAKVAEWRKERGIQRNSNPAKRIGRPEWIGRIEGRLGKEEDSVLAREAGVIRERVRQVREQLGIDLDHNEIRKSRAYRQMDAISPRLREVIGTMSDYDVVREFGGGFSHAAVHRWRSVLGIQAVGEAFVARRGKSALNAFAHMFGKYTDAEIARASGLTAHGVRFYRERHGIPIFSRRKKVVAPDAGS